MSDLVLTCSGRAVNDRLQPVGDPCGAVYRRPQVVGREWVIVPAGSLDPRPADDARYIQSARAARWSVAEIDGTWHVTCPKCRTGKS